jgi:hypothetical protein
MSTLRALLQDYLATRRALGFKLHTDGTGLLAFVEFMESAHADYISTDLALAWAKQPTSVRPAWWAQRLVPPDKLVSHALMFFVTKVWR